MLPVYHFTCGYDGERVIDRCPVCHERVGTAR
jgi:hypothetical protein